MELDLTQKTGKPPSFTGTRIIFGRKQPKNWLENLAGQQDPVLRDMIWDWCKEKDPEIKAQKWTEAMTYWTKRRKELGFTDKKE